MRAHRFASATLPGCETAGAESFTGYDGMRLGCQLYLPYTGPEGCDRYPVALIVPGFGGTRRSPWMLIAAKAMLSLGFATLCIDISPNRVDPRHEHLDLADTSALTPSAVIGAMNGAFQYLDKKPDINLGETGILSPSFGAYGTLGRFRYERDGITDRKMPESPRVTIRGQVLKSTVTEPLARFQDKITPWKVRGWWVKGKHRENIAGLKQAIAYNLYMQCKDVDLARDIAPLVTCPTLFLHGDSDPLAPVSTIEEFRSNMPETTPVQIEVIKGVSHRMERVDELHLMPTHRMRRLVSGSRRSDSRQYLQTHLILEHMQRFTEIDRAVSVAQNFLISKAFPHLNLRPVQADAPRLAA